MLNRFKLTLRYLALVLIQNLREVSYANDKLLYRFFLSY